jgi:hypothetical protein
MPKPHLIWPSIHCLNAPGCLDGNPSSVVDSFEHQAGNNFQYGELFSMRGDLKIKSNDYEVRAEKI